MLIYQYTMNAQYAQGIQSGREALELLGIPLAKHNLKQELIRERELALSELEELNRLVSDSQESIIGRTRAIEPGQVR